VASMLRNLMCRENNNTNLPPFLSKLLCSGHYMKMNTHAKPENISKHNQLFDATRIKMAIHHQGTETKLSTIRWSC
jgi:hypothetical protein